MKFSVIIPTYNRRDVFLRTLPTVLAQDFPAGEYEVVIVVDGSSDGTTEALRGIRTDGCNLRVLEQPNRGQAAARNLGLQAALGDLVLNLDDDIVCDPSLLRKHLDLRSTADDLIVAGPLPVHPDSPPSLAVDLWRRMTDLHTKLLERGERQPPWDLWMANCSLPRNLLLKLGGFDESMWYCHEDQELGIRLWKAGVPFRFHPGAVAYHLYVKSAHDLVRTDASRDGRSGVILSRKYPEFRSASALAHISAGSWPRRLLRRVAVGLPFSTEPVFRPLLIALNSLRGIPALRGFGMRLLGTQYQIEATRAGIRVVGSWKTAKAEFGKTLPVLLYHHVGPPQLRTDAYLTVSPEQFERQVRWFYLRGYRSIRSSDWYRWRCEGTGLPEKPLLFTFDDAYADICTHALPILQRYRFGATVFVVTGLIGGTNEWDEARGFGTHPLMTAEQIRYWAAHGIEFGAHGRTHADLTTLTGSNLVEEVVGSRDELAAILGQRVAVFAYPYGRYNEQVQECGRTIYDLAFGIESGLNDLRINPFALKRTLVVEGHSGVCLEYHLRWELNLMGRIRAKVRLRSRLKHAVSSIVGRGAP